LKTITNIIIYRYFKDLFISGDCKKSFPFGTTAIRNY